jgi:hypothetical protein
VGDRGARHLGGVSIARESLEQGVYQLRLRVDRRDFQKPARADKVICRDLCHQPKPDSAPFE